MSVQCQASCSGEPKSDNTVRVCKSNDECPPNLPVCGGVTINGLLLYICGTS